jgi:predicted RecA/RadA family phage recombinase
VKKFFLVCMCLLALAACGSTSSNQGTATTPLPTTAKTVPPVQHFKVGQVVKVGDTWQVTINSAKTSPHGQFSKPQKSGNVFLIFQISVKNISNQEKNISSIAQFDLTDTTGQKYAASYDDEAGAMLDGKVEPGSPLKGSLVFEVPQGVHDYRLAFEAELFQSGQIVWDIHV